MKHMFKFNKKEGENRNLHLTQTNFHDSSLLHAFLTQERVLDSSNLPHFGIVGTGTCCGRRQMISRLQHSTRSGITSSCTTLMRKITPLNINFDENTKKYHKHTTSLLLLWTTIKGNNVCSQRNGS